MGKGKLEKFAELETFPNVVQMPPREQRTMSAAGATNYSSGDLSPVMRASDLWKRLSETQSADKTPLVLELGCGRGEYTVGLARKFPEKNFIGVDIKGARIWNGAKQALTEDIRNAGFLRTDIEFIDRFFLPAEVDEIWLTFSDPQMKKVSKRLTSSFFLQRYRRIMPDGGLIHLKTDSNFLFTYTRELLRVNHIEPDFLTENIYEGESEPLLREIRTYYEQQWMDRGIAIKYLRFRLPQEGMLVEPEVEIPLDDYRSYNRHKRSGKDVAK